MELYHHGVIGMKWGVRRYQDYNGKRINSPVEKRKVFISGSSKTQSEDSPYYRKELPRQIRDKVDSYISDHAEIIVGDAPGIDRQVQDYLNSKGYKDVSVYGPGENLRYLANDSWRQRPISAPEFEPGSKEWLAKKDLAMERAATEGLAVVLDEGAKATRKNVERLLNNNKDVSVYELSKDGSNTDRWVTGVVKQTSLQQRMNKEIEYDYSDHPLKSPKEVDRTKSGNCHDQTLYAMTKLKEIGVEPKAAFLIEVDPKSGQGGTTHSFAYYNDGGRTKWFENAWGGREGIRSFDSFSDIQKEIEAAHKNREFGDPSKYRELVWGEFRGEPGDDLQQIVDKSLR